MPEQLRLGALEREGKGLLRDLRHERLDDPAQCKRHIARERERLTLDVRATVALEEAPVRVQTIHETVFLSLRLLALLWRARIHDFGDLGAADAAVCAIGRQPEELSLVFRVQRYADYLLHLKTQRHAKALILPVQQLRSRDVRSEHLG